MFYRLTEDQWREQFSPILRPDGDGDCFYGEDEDDRAFVEAQPEFTVWSEIYSFDSETAHLVNGYIDVDDGAYYVCQSPWLDGDEYEISLNDFSGEE